MTVTRDATSLKYVPASSAEWTELLSGTGLSNPSSLWLCQEAAGNLADSIGAVALTANGSPQYQQAVSGMTRLGIKPRTDTFDFFQGVGADISATSEMLMLVLSTGALNARTLAFFGTGTFIEARTSASSFDLIDGANTATGSAAPTAPTVLFIKIDRSRSETALYNNGTEVIKPTWSAPSASTAFYIGGVNLAYPDATIAYAAMWTGAAAEMSDAQVATLLSRIDTGAPAVSTVTTRDAFAAGSVKMQWVIAIDGYKYIHTDGDTDAALAAWAGTDWTQALDGLTVVCRPSQSADPNNPFPGGGGSCLLYMKSYQDPASDTFGIDVFRRGGGAWTTLGGTIDRNDTAVVLRNNTSFPAGPSEAHIGVECVEYSGTTSSSMTVTTRGKYTAVGCAASGSGGDRFADHHRVSIDQNQVQSNPLISEQPRRWLDRRVHCYLHVVDENGDLNSKADAELVYEGRIDSISDDAETKCTLLKLRHVLDELASAVVVRNPWGGYAAEGLYIPAGAVFKLKQYRNSTTKDATDLTVVASGAAGSNQINAGHYTLKEISGFLNAWCGGERAASRIDGRFTWESPVSTDAGVRTVIGWLIEDASNTTIVGGIFTFPAGVVSMLGFGSEEGVDVGGSAQIFCGFGLAYANTGHFRHSDTAPYRTAVFSKGGPGGMLPTFQIEVDNERGEFVDQYEFMPSIIKPGLDSTLPWGLFLVDEKLLIQASYADGVLSGCFITPLGQNTLGDSGQPFYTLGRRADDDAGAVPIRQVFDIEGSFEQIMNLLHYNTGTPGYNHATYDTQAVGIGIGLQGGLLGDAFETSVKNLPRAQASMRLKFDEPTTLKALIGDELIARRAFPVWKNGGIVYQQWHTPVVALASFELNEENKARPAKGQENPLTPTLETNQYARPVVKFDFDPDFAFGRDVRYRASMQLEDQVGVDDGGSSVVSPMTVKLRNTAGQEDALALQSGYLATMPMTARPSKILNRSLSPRHFFGIAPGDMCTVIDEFARDPLTGLRWNPLTRAGGLDSRPATVMRHSFDLGGPVPGDATAEEREMAGDIDVNFFDVNRGSAYAPSADIDETLSTGGFSAGYNSATLQLTLKAHAYSESTEPVDAASLGDGYAIIIVEKDPANPAAPIKWERTLVGSAIGDVVTLNSALSAPAWDATKKYRVIFNKYSTATSLQRDCAFQADEASEMVESVETAYHWCSTPEEDGYTINTDQYTEFMPDLAAIDGASLDVGHETALVVAANNLHDHKTAHHAMFMWTEQGSPPSLDVWTTKHFGRIYLGMDQLSNAVFRYLTIAPWFWLYNGLGATTAQVRVTLSRDVPTQPIGINGGTFDSPQFKEFYSQATWSSVSTTEAMGTPTTLEVRVKDLFWGMAYVTVEVKNAFCRGLAQAREGARVLVL